MKPSTSEAKRKAAKGNHESSGIDARKSPLDEAAVTSSEATRDYFSQPERAIPESEPSNESQEDLNSRIARRAYELYENRGRRDGHDLDDWLEAELEIRQNN